MSSASAASSSSKKVEWYHLDRVAIAKRICLDPSAVKLKTALNNNNNNDYKSSGSKSGKNSGAGSNNVSTGVSGSNSSSAIISASTTVVGGSSTSREAKKAKSSTTYEQRTCLHPKPLFESTTSRLAQIAESLDPPKGLFSSLRYPASGCGAPAAIVKSIPPSFHATASSAGSRQFAALQQKRRRKAARAALAVAPQPQTKESGRDCKGLLGEECLLVKGGTSGVGSSCGSSSRSSSNGVSSDFEELDASSSSISPMKGTSASPRWGGDCQSSSDCEDEDEESSILPLPHPFISTTKRCNTICTANCSNDGSNHNLSNLNILNSVSVLIDGVGASGGKSGGVKLSKAGGGRVGVILDPSRIVNGKIAFKTTLNGTGKRKARTTDVAPGNHTSTNGSTSASSSASSTTSGSTDNDRDTDNSFSEFPTDLDFMGVVDKEKRRTDRYDSSESSDSGVATLSPSTSDSPELISTCCDFTSEHLDEGNLISASRSSSLSTTSLTYPTNSSKSASPSSSSSASSTSSCSGTSAASLTERQDEPATGSVSTTTIASTITITSTNASIIEASLPSSTGSDTGSSIQTNPPVHQEPLCLWKGCTCSTTEASHNILEHIQEARSCHSLKLTVGDGNMSWLDDNLKSGDLDLRLFITGATDESQTSSFLVDFFVCKSMAVCPENLN